MLIKVICYSTNLRLSSSISLGVIEEVDTIVPCGFDQIFDNLTFLSTSDAACTIQTCVYTDGEGSNVVDDRKKCICGLDRISCVSPDGPLQPPKFVGV